MEKFDCIVAGAGMGGFAAAIAASRAGAKVLLIDKLPSAGGTAVYAMSALLSGWPLPQRAGGIADELAQVLQQRNGLRWRSGNAAFDENIMQLAMLDMLRDARVKTIFNALVIRVESVGKIIKNITVQTGTKELIFEAKNFVDATGDASLSVLAGADVITPPVDKSMTKTLMFKVNNVKNFDKESIARRFSEKLKTKKFPVVIQDRFMGTTLVRDDEAILNLTAVAGDAADPVQYNAMYEELLRQIPEVTAWLKKEFPEFEDITVSKISPVLGVRCTRNIISRRLCGSYIGGHYVKGFASPWSGSTGKMAVPYGAIRSCSFDNLLAAGRIIGIAPELVSAVRLNVSCMSSGQAAGIAAALNIPPYEKLRKELLRQNCLLSKQEL